LHSLPSILSSPASPPHTPKRNSSSSSSSSSSTPTNLTSPPSARKRRTIITGPDTAAGPFVGGGGHSLALPQAGAPAPASLTRAWARPSDPLSLACNPGAAQPCLPLLVTVRNSTYLQLEAVRAARRATPKMPLCGGQKTSWPLTPAIGL